MNIDPCVERSFAAFLFAAGIAIYDYFAGANISLWALYMGPIGIAAWGCGMRGAIAFATLSSLLVIAVDTTVGHPYPTVSHYVVAAASHTFALFAVALLLGYVYRLLGRIKELESVRERYYNDKLIIHAKLLQMSQ